MYVCMCVCVYVVYVCMCVCMYVCNVMLCYVMYVCIHNIHTHILELTDKSQLRSGSRQGRRPETQKRVPVGNDNLFDKNGPSFRMHPRSQNGSFQLCCLPLFLDSHWGWVLRQENDRNPSLQKSDTAPLRIWRFFGHNLYTIFSQNKSWITVDSVIF